MTNGLNRRQLFSMAGAALPSAQASTGRPPNILFLISDDHSAPHLGCYGDTFARTPAIDRLAGEGVRFTNAYVTAPQCSPSRSSYFSGATPHAVGTSRQASHYPARQPSVIEVLRSRGYRTAAFGKVHQGEVFDRRFDAAAPNPDEFSGFLSRNPASTPWFVQIGYRQPHRPYRQEAQAAEFPMESAPVPDWLPDTPEVRGDLCRYYQELRTLDDAVAEALDQLRKHSLENDTLVVFMGDNGMPFPRSKGTLYEAGIHVPLIVRWPGRATAGLASDALVSGLDLPAGWLDAAGASKPEWMEGVSFLPLLARGANPVRRAIYAERNWHNHFDPMRCVTTSRYKLIYNGRPDQPYRPTSDVEASPSWESYRAQYHSARSALKPHHHRLFNPSRPFLELYDLQSDPGEYVNLIDAPEHRETRAEMEFMLSDWMHETQDFLPPLFYTYPARKNPRRRLGV